LIEDTIFHVQNVVSSQEEASLPVEADEMRSFLKKREIYA